MSIKSYTAAELAALTADELDELLDQMIDDIYVDPDESTQLDADDIESVPGLLDRIIAGPTNWAAEIDSGEGGDRDIRGRSLLEAVLIAERWARRGDWDLEDGGLSVEVAVYHPRIESEVVGDESEIDILPDEPECPMGVHYWSAAHEGGCRENPGVWSTGGTGMEYHSHCLCCGMSRVVRETGPQRNPGAADTTRYGEPDPDWVRDHIGVEEADALVAALES
jgi:hypothetical protein